MLTNIEGHRPDIMGALSLLLVLNPEVAVGNNRLIPNVADVEPAGILKTY